MSEERHGTETRFDTESRHLREDVHEIKTRLTNVEATTHEIRLHMAELITKFATVDAVLRMAAEIEQIKADLARQRGMASAGWLLLGTIFTLANLAIAGRGKFW